MLTAVLIANGMIGLICLMAAWHIWKLKCQLTQTADTLIFVEQVVHRVLAPAPRFIRRGQSGTYHLRQNLEHLEPQLQKIQTVMTLLGYSQLIWQRSLVLRQRSPSRKKRFKIR